MEKCALDMVQDERFAQTKEPSNKVHEKVCAEDLEAKFDAI